MKASRKLLLASAALITPLMAAHAAAAADLPIMASPDSWGGWYVDHSSIEFGGQVFIDKPGTGAGARANNTAKFNEYGDRTNAAFLTFLDIGLATKDGRYTADVRAKNVGANDQDIELDLAQPGEHYLTLGWYQTPHLRSTTAQTIFSGVGSTNLWVPDNVVGALYGGLANSITGTGTTAGGSMNTTNAFTGSGTQPQNTPPTASRGLPLGCLLTAPPISTGGCASGVVPVQTTLAQNVQGVTLGLQRDRGEVNYRWTPSPDWDVKVDYSNEHRYGLQEQGFLFSTSTSNPLAQVAAPVDDTTQDASISVEYSGYSPWNMRWNGILRYDASIFTDRYTQFSAESPFGGPGSPDTTTVGGVGLCPAGSSTVSTNCAGTGAEGTAPNNAANAFSATVGVDLPWFKSSRYMGTFNYNMMTQNAPFIPMTNNPTLLPLSFTPTLPGSLNGEIDTLLFNNVLTTQFNSDLKNKLSYRYYSDKNTTPPQTLNTWIMNDALLEGPTQNEYSPHTTLFSSYTKQNASDELTWHPVKWANVGVSSGWQQYQYSMYAANQTNEFTEKVFGDLSPMDGLTVRASDAVSWRRYNNYNWISYIADEMMLPSCTGTPCSSFTSSMMENPLLRDVNIANRNRNLANLYFDITTPIQGLTLTPTVGLRWDDYPNDPTLQASGLSELGLSRDHNWNVGIEANLAINSSTNFMASYTREKIDQRITSDQASGSLQSTGSSIGCTITNTCNALLSYDDISEGVNTWMVAANIQMIPDRLTLKLSGTYENANQTWNAIPVGAACFPTPPTTSCGGVLPGNPAFPAEKTNFYRADAVLTYKVDPAMMTQFGSKGEAFLKLHYMWERNAVTNWQNDKTQVYMYSEINSSTIAMKDMIFMAGDNPNYTAQALMASLVVKW